MIQQTKVGTLATLAVLASAIGWSLSQLWPMWFTQGLPVPTGSAVAMVLLVLSLLVWTLMTRARLKPGSQAPRLHPLVAARTAALAMSASRVGSLFFGFYFGVVLSSIAAANSPAASNRIVVSLVTSTASLLTAAIALWLERICQLPQPPAKPDVRNGSSA
jgi:hypothetical protein